MLSSQGLAFSLPDVAREAGVSAASVYRYFTDVHELHREYHADRIAGLLEGFDELRNEGRRGFELFAATCAEWVHASHRWAKSVTHTRSAEGFLVRVRNGDPTTSAMYRTLSRILAEMVQDGVIPPQNIDYSVLTWITTLDERVMVDLRAELGWSDDEMTGIFTQHLLAVFRAPMNVHTTKPTEPDDVDGRRGVNPDSRLTGYEPAPRI